MHFGTLNSVTLDKWTEGSYYLHVLFTNHWMKSLFLQLLFLNFSLIYQHICYNKVEMCSVTIWLQGSHIFLPTIQVLNTIFIEWILFVALLK
jgi:hypothetical protein